MRNLGIAAVSAALLLALTYLLDPFRDYQLATAAAYLCAAAGLTVLIGVNGQLSLGHGALMAFGAYPVALVQNELADRGVSAQWTLAVSVLAGVAAATALGAVVGVAAARLHGPYLAGLTLVVAVAVPSLATLFGGVLHGDQGLSVYLLPPPAALGPDFPFERWQAWLALAAAVLTMLLLANLMRSRFGRTLRAVRDDEVAARLAGIPVARTRVLAFVVSAACAGLSGAMFAILAQSVSPSAFALTLSLNLLLAVVVGGLGSLAGAVWGSLLLVLLPWLVDTFTADLTLSPDLRQRLAGNLPLAIFGLLLVVVMIAAPGGVQGLLKGVLKHVPQVLAPAVRGRRRSAGGLDDRLQR
ncbi:MAG: branched-chain amino acid ABC transporter permease [Micromonosporaceae bacterium]|jgi:branched-chain amino acid transport system permease protein|nr:branched-chain amino acid ABC transporter permease [Micromonosporaceae bacterium]